MKNTLHSAVAVRRVATAVAAFSVVPFAASTAFAGTPPVTSVSATTTVSGHVIEGNVEDAAPTVYATSAASAFADPIVYSVSATMTVSGYVILGNVEDNPR